MCENTSRLKFCTCAELSDSNKNDNSYYWTLSRLVGLKQEHLIGKVLGPTHDLGNGITTDAITQLINEGNCFDFEYIPSENDTLSISRRSDNYRYFTLIYRNNQWREGQNPSFISITETIAEGRLDIAP
jgi:hypothetical protein